MRRGLAVLLLAGCAVSPAPNDARRADYCGIAPMVSLVPGFGQPWGGTCGDVQVDATFAQDASLATLTISRNAVPIYSGPCTSTAPASCSGASASATCGPWSVSWMLLPYDGGSPRFLDVEIDGACNAVAHGAWFERVGP